MVMDILDFFTRLVLIPVIYLFILAFIPEAIKDIKEWFKETPSSTRTTRTIKPAKENISGLNSEYSEFDSIA